MADRVGGLGLSLWLAAIGVGALAATLWVIEFLALGGGVWLPAGPALVAILGSSLAAYAVRFMLVDRARRRIQRAFARYLSPALVERLAADPSQLRLVLVQSRPIERLLPTLSGVGSVNRIHRTFRSKLSTDQFIVAMLCYIPGQYLTPPEPVLVFSMGEKC